MVVVSLLAARQMNIGSSTWFGEAAVCYQDEIHGTADI